MADRFIGLREFAAKAVTREEEPVEAVAEPPAIEVQPDIRAAAADARRFRAAVLDAVEVTVRAVLCDVAAEVLARELQLAPVNLDAIVARACARYANEGIVRVRVHPEEAAQLETRDVEIVRDSGLRRGDAVLEVRSGTIDVTLGARLDDVLDGLAS